MAAATQLLRFARKRNLAARLRQNTPTGKSVLIFRNDVKPGNQKYFSGAVGQITSTTPPVSPGKGRIMIVTNAGWDAVDAAASARKVVAGRFSVSDARRADERR